MLPRPSFIVDGCSSVSFACCRASKLATVFCVLAPAVSLNCSCLRTSLNSLMLASLPSSLCHACCGVNLSFTLTHASGSKLQALWRTTAGLTQAILAMLGSFKYIPLETLWTSHVCWLAALVPLVHPMLPNFLMFPNLIGT